jgi:hypothetical protein
VSEFVSEILENESKVQFFWWFKDRYHFKTTHLRILTRLPCKVGSKYVWSNNQRVRYQHYHQSLWGGKDNDRRVSLKAAEDCIWRASNSSWWGWDDGSIPLCWHYSE